MNVSYAWLRSLAPTVQGSADELSSRLAMYGCPVDEIVSIGEGLRDVIIARVVEAARHPNADRLSLCMVDAGTGELLSVVCGAPNVKAGTLYPFAPAGSSLPGGVTIKRAKIRGQESNGMLCSARELGLGREHEGILELHGDFTPGESFIEALGLDDYRLVVDVTPNRPDLLSHIGIARELAPGGVAAISLPSFPNASAPQLAFVEADRTGQLEGVQVRIEDGDLCSRYIAAVIRGVRVGPSPEWLASRLRAIGARPINNVVDATNYVLHELGQPLHAFDLKKLRGPEIVVRRAKSGETLVTLDGVERKLADDMLVIADASVATAVAGVMGGHESEVSESTTDVLIECAHFQPQQVRKTRRALGLSTDASQRYERGVDPHGMRSAAQRVVDLITAIAGGTANANAIDVLAQPLPVHTVTVRPSRVATVLGRFFTSDEIRSLLEPIGFVCAGDDPIEVKVPGYRLFDVLEEVDLIEEIARRFGYDRFDQSVAPFRPTTVPDDPMVAAAARLTAMLVGRGFLEARSAAFASESEGDVPLLLPLSSAESRLRRAVLPGLLHRVEYNFTRGTRDVRLFEIGTAFEPAQPGSPPKETIRLAAAITGSRSPAHWTGDAGEFDLWDLKGFIEDCVAALALDASVRPGAGDLPGVTEVIASNESFLVDANGVLRGIGGHVRADRLDAPPWAAPVFAFELVLEPVATAEARPYSPLPVYPPIEQDLALLVPETIPSEQVVAAVRKAGGALLEDVRPFDVYRGTGVNADVRSIAYRLRFRASDRTLTDADASTAVGRILKRLKDEYGIQRRG